MDCPEPEGWEQMRRPPDSHEPADAATTPNNGSTLAQHLWARYGSAPGVIPLHTTVRLAPGMVRLSRDRLPLLDDLQQRWSFSEWPNTPTSAFWHAPLSTGPSVPVGPAVAGHETPWPPPTAATPVRPRPTARSPQMTPDPEPTAARPQPAMIQRTPATPPVGLSAAGPADAVAPTSVQPTSTPASTPLGPAIVQRVRRGEAGMHQQRLVAPSGPVGPEPANADPASFLPLPPGEGTKNLLREVSPPGESRHRGEMIPDPAPEGRLPQRPRETTPVASPAETSLIQRTPAPPPLQSMPPARATGAQPQPSFVEPAEPSSQAGEPAATPAVVSPPPIFAGSGLREEAPRHPAPVRPVSQQRPEQLTRAASPTETSLIQRTPAPPPSPPMPPTRVVGAQLQPFPAPARLPQAVGHRAVEVGRRVGAPPQEMPLAPPASREVAPRGEETRVFIQRYPAHGARPGQSGLAPAPSAATAWLQAQPDTMVTPGVLGACDGGAETQPEETPPMEEWVEKGLRQLLRRLALEGERRGWQPWL
jgi:hypothetical protein